MGPVRRTSSLPATIRKRKFPTMRKAALIGFVIGMTLGFLFGAAIDFFPGRDESKQGASLSVNQVSGRPQLHIKGKPEIE